MSYFLYWGKANTEGSETSSYHLLPYHCLDVAAVGKALLSTNQRLRQQLSRLLLIDENSLVRWAVFMLALHDLGKFAESFQNLRPDLLMALQGKQSNKKYTARHDTLGFELWKKSVKTTLTEKGVINASVRRRRS